MILEIDGQPTFGMTGKDVERALAKNKGSTVHLKTYVHLVSTPHHTTPAAQPLFIPPTVRVHVPTTVCTCAHGAGTDRRVFCNRAKQGLR